MLVYPSLSLPLIYDYDPRNKAKSVVWTTACSYGDQTALDLPGMTYRRFMNVVL